MVRRLQTESKKKGNSDSSASLFLPTAGGFELDDLSVPFQPKWFYESTILWNKSRRPCKDHGIKDFMANFKICDAKDLIS